jgi:hypothetical protein
VERRPARGGGAALTAVGKPFQPQVHHYVGGATKMSGPRSAGCANATAMKGGEPRLAARWSLAEAARPGVDRGLSTEDPPPPGNRVTLDSGGPVHLACRSTNEAMNPALATMANAIRPGEHLLERLR